MPSTSVAPFSSMHARRRQGDWWRRTEVAGALAVAWLASASAALWAFGPGAQAVWSSDPKHGRSAHVFDREVIAKALAEHAGGLVPAPYAASVLHIGSPACRCERRSRPHRARIKAAFTEHPVRFLALDAEDPLAAAVPATPAAIVLARDGRVLYAGPYSNDGMCLPGGGEGPVERSLRALLAGQGQPVLSALGVGCLCTTPPPRG